jgi:energy-coupling factor transport system substrate-specific component
MASFAVLFLALAAGFAWYERSHPSAKVLALVATLAALAVLGRLAFAPLPNVKPTVDIILISGYVLGGAPGFAVGAVSALASNFFFGQGPYTPWQMVGFGAVGVFGAALARVAGRDLGRWPLALSCGVAGFALGTFLDVSMWMTYSGHSLAELVAVSGRGLPFNLALFFGNVAFCLAFGPMLVRALRRFRARFDITWEPLPAAGPGAAATAAAVVVAVVAGGLLLAPAPARADAVSDRAAAYLRSAQNADGGFANARGEGASNAMVTGWVAMGLAAAGDRPSGATAAYLRRQRGRVSDVGDIERTVLALRAAGQDAGPLVAKLQRRRSAGGSYEQLVNRSAFAVLAQRAAGRRADPKTVRWLLGQQNADGGWSLGGKGGESGVDDTAAVVMALASAGRRSSAAVRRATRWLARRQGPDGGFPLSPGDPSNAQSTAFVVMGLVAGGRDPDRVRRGGSRSPVGYLRSLQAADGSIRYSRTSRQTPVWVTAQALIALRRRTLPVRAPRARARAARAPASAPARPEGAGRSQAGGAAAGRRAAARAGRRRQARAARRRAARMAAAHRKVLGAQAHGAGVLSALLLTSIVR